MNWPRIILDGIAMSAVFNAIVLVGFTLWPQEYSVMFPKEIKDAAAPYVNKKDVRKMKLFLYGLVTIEGSDFVHVENLPLFLGNIVVSNTP